MALPALDARGYKEQGSRRGLVYKMEGITEVLLHETAMATAMGAEGLGFGLFFNFSWHFHFLQSGILEGFVSGLLFQTDFCEVVPPFMKLL